MRILVVEDDANLNRQKIGSKVDSPDVANIVCRVQHSIMTKCETFRAIYR